MIAGWAVGLALWVLAVLTFAVIGTKIIEHRLDEQERREAAEREQHRHDHEEN